MSEVLVRQLQQILAPWDLLSEDNETATATAAAAAASSPADPLDAAATVRSWTGTSTQDALAHARAATTKLELARAALALFTSNAGAFRPILVKVFRFLFDHVDALREELAHRSLQQLLWQQGEKARAAAGSGASAALSMKGGTPEEQNAVVAAYEKVHMTESRMAALVEEASVQRDHFKSQIEAQRRQQYHLEDLLQHQMELTQTLLDHRLRQELVGGGAGSAQGVGSADAAAGGGGGSAGTAAVAAGGLPLSTGMDAGAAPSSSRPLLASQQQRSGTVEADGAHGLTRRPAERRDAAYVQRLIQRADRELTLEKTEDQLRDLRAQQDELENKVQSLLKLNTKYARQCVELSARLSIIHENNIALAADVQLYQRDYVKEQQRSANLQHALLVARGIVLTTLQVQPGFAAEEAQEQLDEIDKSADGPLWKRQDRPEAEDNSAAPRSRWHEVTEKAPALPVATSVDGNKTSSKRVAFSNVADPPLLQLDAVDEVAEALRVVPSLDLRKELQAVLQIDDVDSGGKVKAALLKLLELQLQLRAAAGSSVGSFERTFDGNGVNSPEWLTMPGTHLWVPPYGLRPAIPRHLRSAVTIPLLFLNPLLAEAFVHELLTQRQQLLAFAQAQRAEAKLRASQHPSTPSGDATGAEPTSGRGAPAGAELQQLGALATSNTFVAFADFIELFILVVWLNRADRYLPLLPASERTRLEEEARIREEAHARRVSRLITKSITATSTAASRNRQGGSRPPAVTRAHASHTSLWELRHVLHLVRPSAESAHLPFEGLQLTYALDVAAQQATAGPLTYAYGPTSRGTVCEVLFYVLRAERETLLSLCRAVDAAMLAHARGSDQRPSSSLATADPSAAEGDDEGRSSHRRSLHGWIPTVQFVRILLVMYPGYPPTKLEQLIAAAVADGTTGGAESPATLFYEALLPGRMLPGPTTATTAAEASCVPGTRFASLFYGAICDDALASMQIVEDSVYDFVRGQVQQQQQPGGGEGPGAAHAGSGGGGAATAGDAGGASATVTARQITANAFLGLPRSEAQQWGAGLRNAINRWPRLRSTIADPGKAASVSDAALQRLQEATEADKVSTVARVPAGEVMPYLRRNVVVRRGLFANAETAAAAAAPPRNSVTSTPPPNGTAKATATTKRAMDGLDSSITSRTFISNAAESSLAGSPKSLLLSTGQTEGWTPTQRGLLERWEVQWAAYNDLLHGIAASADDNNTSTPAAALCGASPVRSEATPDTVAAAGAAAATRTVQSGNRRMSGGGGPTQAAEFVELLQHLDPYRTRPWGSELVSRDSAVLHPLDYAADWPPETLGAPRRDTVTTTTDAALKQAMAKTSKKASKKAGGAR